VAEPDGNYAIKKTVGQKANLFAKFLKVTSNIYADASSSSMTAQLPSNQKSRLFPSTRNI
jgi:hypothetical protein